MSRKFGRLYAGLVAVATVSVLMAATASTGAASTSAPLGFKHLYPLVSQAAHLRAGLGAQLLGLPGGQLTYHGGPIQKTPKVYITFWGWQSDPSHEATLLMAFFSGVGGSSWANIQTQYSESARGNITNPVGQLKGTWADNSSTPPTSIADAQIAAEAVKSAQHFGGSDPDADYIIATPTGTGTVGFKTQYCAWHNITGNTAFTNLPYITDAGASCGKDFVNPAPAGDTDGITIVGGHEYAEAITDPGAGSGWVDSQGNEDGDKCAWISSGQGKATDIQLGGKAYAVQSLWSDAFKTGGLFGRKGGCVTGF